jgi:hypothetical protein
MIAAFHKTDLSSKFIVFCGNWWATSESPVFGPFCDFRLYVRQMVEILARVTSASNSKMLAVGKADRTAGAKPKNCRSIAVRKSDLPVVRVVDIDHYTNDDE